jgi:hypothetical protein
MHKAIALVCITISATLAALYGYVSADTPLYGAIRAASLGAVAGVGACCPAWASHHWSGRRYGQCVITWFVCAVCLVVTLGGGIGTIAGGAERSTAERAKASSAAKNDDAELARITTELAKLPTHRPTGTVTADLEAARASRAYKLSNACDPTQIAAKAIRDACDAFRKLEGELATAKAAQALDTKAAALRESLAHTPAVQHANPQAAAISNLLHIPVDDAVSLYAFVASLALELAGMASMMRADARTPMDSPATEKVRFDVAAADTKHEQPSNVVALIQPPQKTGTVEKFMLACVSRAKGSSVSWAELYVRYRRWCTDAGVSAMTADMFGKRLDRLRAEGVLRARAKGEDVFCLDVKLVA